MLFQGLFLWMLSSVSLSYDLPKGVDSGPGKKYRLIKSKKQQTTPAECFDFHMNPESGELVFAFNSAFFIGSHPLYANKKIVSDLVRLSFPSLETKKIAKISGINAKLIIHGSLEMSAVTLLSLRGKELECGRGEGQGISLKLEGSKKASASFSKRNYSLVKTDMSIKPIDLEKHSLRDFDASSKQERVLVTIPEKAGIPLYIDRENKLAYNFLSRKSKSLIRFNYQMLELKSKLKLAEGMKLVQQDDKFGVATLNHENKTIVVNRIRGWSGKDFKKFVIIPKELPYDKVRVLADFRTGLMALIGKTEVDTMTLRHVEIYDANEQNLLIKIEPPPKMYVSHAALSPDAEYLVALMKRLDDKSLGAVSVFNMRKRELKAVHLR